MQRPISLRPSRALVALVIAPTLALLVLSGALWRLGRLPGAADTGPTFYHASAVTSDYRDVDLTIDRRTGAPTIRRALGASAAGSSIDAAPLLGREWENKDVREGREMRWCLQDLDVASAHYLREALDTLAREFPTTGGGKAGIRWRETCDRAPYTTGRTAAQDCGMEGAVACAVIYSPTSGRVSVGQAFLDAYRDRNEWRRVAMAHEVQHLLLALGHNSCGKILDPVTGQPVGSVMTPVDLVRGTSCSEPPAYGLEPADWHYALAYYGLKRGGQPPANQPTPVPTPIPTPAPTPRPTPTAQVAAQRWVRASDEPCASPSDGLCIQTYPLDPPPPAGAWYPIVVGNGAGGLTFPFGFPFVAP